MKQVQRNRYLHFVREMRILFATCTGVDEEYVHTHTAAMVALMTRYEALFGSHMVESTATCYFIFQNKSAGGAH